MGTWKLTNFPSVRVFPVGTGNWDVSNPNAPELEAQTPSFVAQWGQIIIPFSGAQLYLDGSVTPTAYEDLPADFGIDSITYENDPSWVSDGVNSFAPDFPITSDDGNSPVLRGGGAEYYWTIEPVGLSQYKMAALNQSTILLVSPYLGVGYPPVFTKWNGFLETLLSQGTFRIRFSQMPVQFGAYLLWVFTQFATFGADGIATSNFWEINGTYNSYPAPVNPVVSMVGSLDFSGDEEVRVLTDASGIYTLVPGQYKDELWQRAGTTATATSYSIPRPFFKTGYIGGN